MLKGRVVTRLVNVELEALDAANEQRLRLALEFVLGQEMATVMYQMVHSRDDVFDALRSNKVNSGSKDSIFDLQLIGRGEGGDLGGILEVGKKPVVSLPCSFGSGTGGETKGWCWPMANKAENPRCPVQE